jgi:hypothetical protein
MLRTQKATIYTTTEEPFMPVRLYYKVHNEYLLIKALKKLKCVIIEPGRNLLFPIIRKPSAWV